MLSPLSLIHISIYGGKLPTIIINRTGLNPYAARMRAMLIFAFFPLVVLLAQPLELCIRDRCILRAKETAILEISTIGTYETGHCLPYRTGRVLKRNIPVSYTHLIKPRTRPIAFPSKNI